MNYTFMKINYYDRFFYLNYAVLSKLGSYDLGFSAVLLFSGLIFAHVLSIMFFLFERSDIYWFGTYFGVGIIGLPILIGNYFCFVAKERYKKISDKLQGRKPYYSIGGLVYITVTVVLLMFSITK